MQMKMKLRASKDGTLKGSSQIDIDGGAYASFGLITANMLASYSLAQLVMKPTISRRHATIPTNQHAQNGGTVRCNPVSLLKLSRSNGRKAGHVSFELRLKISWVIFRKRSTGNKWVPQLDKVLERRRICGTPVNQHTPN